MSAAPVETATVTAWGHVGLTALQVHQRVCRALLGLLLLLLCGPRRAAAGETEEQGALSEWDVWKMMHAISYDEHQDDMERRVIWEHNSRLIENNNQQYFMGAKPFSMAMNKRDKSTTCCKVP
ncbi:hypothetical protein CRUP_026212 [Coryphaenoides rupestris]|nr:hypothetical protein CRUP_026212 [Coryphaenoides rupestris]